MKAVVISEFGGPDVLQIQERDIPNVGVNDILIKVRAAGVNRPDIFQRKGNYPAPGSVAADIPGLEVSGLIEQIGKDVVGFSIGDKVMALVAGAGYAEFVAVDAGSCILMPDNISFEEAAGMPETIYTVWHNVFQRGKLVENNKLLIHGGAGGIGTTAVQLGVLFGAEAYATVGTSQKKEFVEELGASKVFNYNETDFEDELRSEKVDVILDCIGGEYFNKNLNVIKDDGRLVYINAMQGAKVELNLLKLMQKRVVLTGSTLRNRSNEFKASLTKEIVAHIIPLIKEGKFKTYIYRVFPIEEAAEAHRLMESRDFIGKIILRF